MGQEVGGGWVGLSDTRGLVTDDLRFALAGQLTEQLCCTAAPCTLLFAQACVSVAAVAPVQMTSPAATGPELLELPGQLPLLLAALMATANSSNKNHHQHNSPHSNSNTSSHDNLVTTCLPLDGG